MMRVACHTWMSSSGALRHGCRYFYAIPYQCFLRRSNVIYSSDGLSFLFPRNWHNLRWTRPAQDVNVMINKTKVTPLLKMYWRCHWSFQTGSCPTWYHWGAVGGIYCRTSPATHHKVVLTSLLRSSYCMLSIHINMGKDTCQDNMNCFLLFLVRTASPSTTLQNRWNCHDMSGHEHHLNIRRQFSDIDTCRNSIILGMSAVQAPCGFIVSIRVWADSPS